MSCGSALLIAITASALVSLHAAQQEPTFRLGVNVVPVYATVTTVAGEPADGLTAGDFEILDDGRPREISVFSSEPQAITAVLLFDLSSSGYAQLLQLQAAGADFVRALEPGDRARIGTIGNEVTISPLLTGDKAYLMRVLAEEMWPGGWTYIWNGLDAAMTSLEREAGRRVIILFSDGHWPPSRGKPVKGAAEVMARADREHFLIYSIGYRGWVFDRKLRDVSASTGGGYTELPINADLGIAFQQAVKELHHQYLLGFVPEFLNNRVHTISVRVKRPGLRVRARGDYLASAR